MIDKVAVEIVYDYTMGALVELMILKVQTEQTAGTLLTFNLNWIPLWTFVNSSPGIGE